MAQTTSTNPRAERIVGDICWNELHSHDPNRARPFYEKVVGWRAHACAPVPGGHAYTEWVRPDGAHVGGMMELPAGGPAHVPSNWAIYINVDDVDEAVAKAITIGGRVLTPAFNVPKVGRLAALADPSGAVFHVVTGVGDTGTRVPQDTPGSFCWMELLTRDPAACTRFYGELLGWTTTVMKMPHMEYTLLWRAGADPEKKQGSVGGMMAMPPEWGEIPSSWLSYIMVDDIDAATERVKQAGGTVAMGPTDIPDVGRFTVAMDPTDATFALFASTNG